MNRPIRNVAVAAIVMVIALLANATWIQVFRAEDLRDDTRNTRVQLDEYSRQRGVIVASDGTVLAESVPTDNKFKYLRQYPASGNPKAFAPITGFFARYQSDPRGLEVAENSVLNGNDDRLFTQRFMDMFSGRDPRGGNVVTTIDPKLQRVAYRELVNSDCDGPCRGAVVALEPSSGKILALASTPSYDPNTLATQDFTKAAAAWKAINAVDDVHSPLINRAIGSLYPPGSTFKVISTATALSSGLNADTRLTAASRWTLPGSDATLSNDSGSTCPDSTGGTVSLTQAFQYSCNTAFAQLLTQKVPGDKVSQFKSTASDFGIGDDTADIPLDVSESSVGDIGDDLAALGQSAIGQRDVRLTVLQNAMIAATVANGGVRMQPYLVDKLQTADLRTIATTAPTTLNRPLTAAEATTITDMMIKSEQHTRGAQSGIASKTGTAEHSDQAEGGETPYAWYIAFSPSSNSRIAVAVMVENGAQGQNAYGGVVAAPIGRAVMNAYTGGAR
ncbi:penicillin-binding protein A [Gordonia spumicola]|uniref:Penicillin-binding protein A n=1 Tax=Gordonia spumicola TaxID=589161 RepID=A0A7I9V685_9ACTN|nr:penicillin-binding protein 2 [Gordonia spumicola]GEE00571.1 penicillin-binding protein A [Gordonia spumicola]